MDDSKGRFEMNWFKTERHEATQAAGEPTELNALDRLTQSAAVLDLLSWSKGLA